MCIHTHNNKPKMQSSTEASPSFAAECSALAQAAFHCIKSHSIDTLLNVKMAKSDLCDS